MLALAVLSRAGRSAGDAIVFSTKLSGRNWSRYEPTGAPVVCWMGVRSGVMGCSPVPGSYLRPLVPVLFSFV